VFGGTGTEPVGRELFSYFPNSVIFG